MRKFVTGPHWSLRVIFSFLFTISSPLLAADTSLLDKLIKEARYQEAYLEATRLQDELTGQPNFDFLYAISAIESGHPQHAIFALERLVSQFPENGRVKVELARAHLLSGDDKTAEEIFNDVLKTSPPENVVKNIQAFLQLIETKRQERQNKFSGTVGVTAGWDNNFNSAPNLNIVQIGGLSFSLNENSKQQDTSYTAIDLNVSYQQFINKKLLMNYGAFFQTHQNVGNELDTESTGIYIAPLISSSNSNFRVPLQFQQLSLDGDTYRRYGSLGIEWMPSGDKHSQWTHFLQYGVVSYPDQDARDMRLATVGSSYAVRTHTGNLYQTALYYSDETSKLDKGKSNEMDSLGLRGYAKWPVSSNHSIYSKISLLRMKFGKTHPVFNMLREDRQYSLNLGWEMNLNRVTTLKAEAEYLRNSSNIEVYTYSRNAAFISLLYQFL